MSELKDLSEGLCIQRKWNIYTYGV